MQTLSLDQGDIAKVKSTELPKGQFVKIQPQTVDFLEISDPKAVLEQAFRSFSTLCKGDIIQILYNCITFDIQILEVKPEGEGISILETDLEVDFAPPVGYIEPTPQQREIPSMASKLNINTDEKQLVHGAGNARFGAFQGTGQTLNGKTAGPKQQATNGGAVGSTPRVQNVLQDSSNRLVPAALNLPFGKLFFGYEYKAFKTVEEKEAEAKSAKKAFQGTGNVLKPSRRTASAGTSRTASAQGQSPQTPSSVTSSAQRLGGVGRTNASVQPSAAARDVTDVIRIEDDDDYISIDSDEDDEEQQFSDAEEEL